MLDVRKKMTTQSRTLLVTCVLISLGSIVALILVLNGRTADESAYKTGPFVSIDEVLADPAVFDGEAVTMVCYLWPGMEGLGLSTMPTNKRWVWDDELNRSVCHGSDLLARCTRGWDWPLYDDSSVQNAFQTGDALVVVEGVFHESNYGPAGSLLEAASYIEVQSCRPLIRSGGRLRNAALEEN